MNDDEFMAVALEQASIAASLGEVPVGAVVVWQGRVIATGRNASVQSHDPTAHAEIVALRSAAKVLGNYRLDECELFVTLEPCAMCSGAVLGARLKRVVFGASEPKTGAAGSVINLFTQLELNHQTELLGGVLAGTSRALMQEFFRQRRADQRTLAIQRHPLRDDSLRTPDLAFESLSGYPWTPRYRNDLVALEGLRIHYLDEQTLTGSRCGESDTATYLCLHGSSAWSYQFHKIFDGLIDAGHRVVAPDLIGFGKSDKPKRDAFHILSRHCRILSELVDKLDLHHIILVLPGQSNLLGLMGMMLPMYAPMRYQGLRLINSTGLFQADEVPISNGLLLWRQMSCSLLNHRAYIVNNGADLQSNEEMSGAFEAPFPGQSFRSGTRAFSDIEKVLSTADSLELQHQAEKFWLNHF